MLKKEFSYRTQPSRKMPIGIRVKSYQYYQIWNQFWRLNLTIYLIISEIVLLNFIL